MNFTVEENEDVQKAASVDEAPGTFYDASTYALDESITIQKSLEHSPTEFVRHSCACCASITSSAIILSDAQPTMSPPLEKKCRAPAILVTTANHESDNPGQEMSLVKYDSLQTFYTVQLSVIRLQKFVRGYLVRLHDAYMDILQTF